MMFLYWIDMGTIIYIFFPGSAPIMINDFSFRWHMGLTISGCLITLYYVLFLYVCLRSSYCYRPINPCVNIIPYKKRQRFLPMSPLYQLLVAKTQYVHKCWQEWLLENSDLYFKDLHAKMFTQKHWKFVYSTVFGICFSWPSFRVTKLVDNSLFRWGVYMYLGFLSSDSKIMYWVKSDVHFGVFYFFGFLLSLREIHNVDLKVFCPQRPYNRITLIENKTSHYSGAYFGFNETVKANNPNSFVFFVQQ